MRQSRLATSQHGSTSSLAVFTESPASVQTRAPLFDDPVEGSMPGNVHLLSDVALQRLLDSNGSIHLLRQMAKDLAERETQLTELRKRSEVREKSLKAMLHDSGVSRIEVERRLASILPRRPSSESVLSGRAGSSLTEVDSLGDQLLNAMGDTALHSHENHTRLRDPQTHNMTSNGTDETIQAGQKRATHDNPADQRPQTGSSFSKWSAGLFGWNPVPKSPAKHIQTTVRRRKVRTKSPVPSVTSTLRDGSNSSLFRRVGLRSEPVIDKTEESIFSGLPPTNSSGINQWPDGAAPSHFKAIVLAQRKWPPGAIFKYGEQSFVTKNASSTISDLAYQLILQGANLSADCSTSIRSYDKRHSLENSLNVQKAKQSTNTLASEDESVTPAMSKTNRTTPSSAIQHRIAIREPSTMEMATIIPEADQPPTMLPIWQAKTTTGGDAILTDRYGFRLFDRASISESADKDVIDESCGDIQRQNTPTSNATRSDTFHDTNHNDHPINAPDRSAISSDDRSLQVQASMLASRPLPPETSLSKSGAIFSNEKNSARLHMLTQLDLYGADKAKQELWDNFLRKTKEDRRRPDKTADQVADQNEDELIGIASIGTGRMARERKRELASLVLAGIPIAYRPKIWGEMTGAYRMKEPGYYEELLSHGHDTDLACVEQIELDLKRTMPGNVFFSGTGSGVSKLRRVLLAFSRHNTEVGYCQGMNVIAATLLLTHPTEEDAFFVLACIVENILPSRYFTPDLLMSRADQIVLKRLVKDIHTNLHRLLIALSIDLEAITFGWFLSVFTDCLPAEFLFRTWDIFFIEGHAYLFCTALAILKLHEKEMLNCDSPAEVYTLLRELPRTPDISVDEFVRSMEQSRSILRQRDLDVIKLHAAAIVQLESGSTDDE